MRHIITALGALAVSTTLAQAGGFERSSVPLGFMFEKGNYAELTFGMVNPSVKGRAVAALGGGSLGQCRQKLFASGRRLQNRPE